MTDADIDILGEGFRFGFELRKFCEDRLESRGEGLDAVWPELIEAIKEIALGEVTMIDSDNDYRLEHEKNPVLRDEVAESIIDSIPSRRKRDRDTAETLSRYFKVL